MEKSPRVLIVGSYMEDQLFTLPAFPRPGETVKGHFARGPGGKGSNQAIAAGRMGANVLFVGAVGRDAAGRDARDFYAREGIGCHLIEKKAATGTASIWVNAAGQNEIIIAPGANAELTLADVPARTFRSAALVMTQWEGEPSFAAAVLRAARAAGAVTLLNPAPFVAGFDPGALRAVDILVPNETEFLGLVATVVGRRLSERQLGALPERTLHGLCRRLGVPTVIVTLGARGCLVSTPDRAELLPAHQGIPVVDTTGAGDAFCGGFAAAWAAGGGDVFAAAKMANATAALSVGKPGTAGSMPRLAAVRAFLRSVAGGRGK